MPIQLKVLDICGSMFHLMTYSHFRFSWLWALQKIAVFILRHNLRHENYVSIAMRPKGLTSEVFFVSDRVKIEDR